MRSMVNVAAMCVLSGIIVMAPARAAWSQLTSLTGATPTSIGLLQGGPGKTISLRGVGLDRVIRAVVQRNGADVSSFTVRITRKESTTLEVVISAESNAPAATNYALGVVDLVRTYVAPVQITVVAPPPDDPEQQTTAFGGSGGITYNRRCATGSVLTGVIGVAGDWMDAVGAICAPVRTDGTLGTPSSSALAGGDGGTSGTIERRCSAGKVVTSVQVRHGLVLLNNLRVVLNLVVVCSAWDPVARTWSTAQPQSLAGFNSGSGRESRTDTPACASQRQPATGIHGRAARYLDSFGLYCDEPP
jgi:hypothetical protein